MSGPNTSYDPVEVMPLRADQVEEMREQAFVAIAGAQDLAELKQVRIDHTGDRSPLALANREIGALPPQARKEAGQRVGQARGAVQEAIAARASSRIRLTCSSSSGVTWTGSYSELGPDMDCLSSARARGTCAGQSRKWGVGSANRFAPTPG